MGLAVKTHPGSLTDIKLLSIMLFNVSQHLLNPLSGPSGPFFLQRKARLNRQIKETVEMPLYCQLVSAPSRL